MCTRKFVAWGSRPRPGGRATPLTLGRHREPFGSGRTTRSLHGHDLVGACSRLVVLDPQRQRQQGSRLGLLIGTRLALGACSEAPERPRMDTTISQQWPCGPRTAPPPWAPNPAAGGSVAVSETGFSRPRDFGTRRRCPPYSGERPKRHGHARLAHRSTFFRGVAGYHPLTRA